MVMPKAQAIVTDSGSISGHMASLSREFSVPTLLDTKVATQTIAPGQIVTVDAYTCRVYQGQVPELLDHQPLRESHLKDTPVYKILEQVAESILPLRLVDPRSPDFSPDHCRSLHDLGRLVHEFSYTEMFKISDLVSAREGYAVKLDAPIPLDLYLIDLGRRLDGSRSRGPQGNPGPGGLGAPSRPSCEGCSTRRCGLGNPAPCNSPGSCR